MCVMCLYNIMQSLLQACKDGDIKSVQQILKAKTDVNYLKVSILLYVKSLEREEY